MSTRCQIEFCNGSTRRTVYRHWDGYPSAVIPDLLEFLAWSTRRGDVEYESANFLYWSKRELGKSEQLGFGICANDELHGDIEYYYVVRCNDGQCTISAHEVEHAEGAVRVGRVIAVTPVPSFSSLVWRWMCLRRRASGLPRVLLDGGLFHQDDRSRSLAVLGNPHEAATFEELVDTA